MMRRVQVAHLSDKPLSCPVARKWRLLQQSIDITILLIKKADNWGPHKLAHGLPSRTIKGLLNTTISVVRHVREMKGFTGAPTGFWLWWGRAFRRECLLWPSHIADFSKQRDHADEMAGVYEKLATQSRLGGFKAWAKRSAPIGGASKPMTMPSCNGNSSPTRW